MLHSLNVHGCPTLAVSDVSTPTISATTDHTHPMALARQTAASDPEPRLCGSLWGWAPSALSLLAVAVAVFWRSLDTEPSSTPLPLHTCPGRTVPSGDLYAVLGVAREFAAPQLKAQYRKLALQWHPDKNEDCAAAASVFAQVSRAFAVLSSPELRDVYDRLGDAGLQRLQDGDPRVSKDWVPPSEVLRRHGLSEEQLRRRWDSLDDVVTNLFSYLNIV